MRIHLLRYNFKQDLYYIILISKYGIHAFFFCQNMPHTGILFKVLRLSVTLSYLMMMQATQDASQYQFKTWLYLFAPPEHFFLLIVSFFSLKP